MTGYVRRGIGLGLLHPSIRVVLAIALATLFTWVSSIEMGAIALVTSVIMLSLNGRIVLPRLFVFVVVIEIIRMVIGNALFSPVNGGGPDYWIYHFKSHLIFRINWLGIELGIIGSLKRVAMIAIGFAVLSCTDIPDFYRAFNIFNHPTIAKWLMHIFRLFQLKIHDLTRLRQSLSSHGLNPGWTDLRSRFLQVRLLLEGVVNRIFAGVGKATFAGATHRPSQTSGHGRVFVQNLFVDYDDETKPILQGIDLDIQPGEFVYLGGANGAGKTTFLRALSGYIPRLCGQYRGKILIDGENLSEMDLREIASKVRFISDDPKESIVGLTVGQDTMLLTENESEARHCLEVMGIADLWDRQTDNLSGGQQARLILSGVLASGAKVVLLDNPLEQLDGKGRLEFLEALIQLCNAKEKTIIVSDHFLYEFIPYVNRYIFLEEGKVIENLPAPLDIEKTMKLLRRYKLGEISLPSRVVATPTSDVMVEMKDVELKIDDIQILRGFNFSVRAGEMVAVVGPNGSGKTTSMLTMAGLVRPKPQKGIIHQANGVTVSYVFQEADLQTIKKLVNDELRLSPIIRSWKSDETENFVSEQLKWIGVQGIEETEELHPAKTRLLSCASMLPGANVLVFDEPTAGLDTDQVEQVLNLMKNLAQKGKGVVVISHDPRAVHIASRVVSIDNGKVIQNGPSLLNEAPMNLIRMNSGYFKSIVFEYGERKEKKYVIAMINNSDNNRDWLLRVQFGCIYGNVFGSIDCDCGFQVVAALEKIQKEGPGAVLYLLGEEGRGHGLGKMARMLAEEHRNGLEPLAASQSQGLIYANYDLFECVPHILERLEIKGPVRLLTNSPQKYAVLACLGVPIKEVIPLEVQEEKLSERARKELEEKRKILGFTDKHFKGKK